MDIGKDLLNISVNEEYIEKDRFDILSIFKKEYLEEIQNVISDVTGMAFITVDFKGEPVTNQTGFTNFCKKKRQDLEYLTRCKISDATGSVIAATTKKTSIYFCCCGLLEIAIPIVVNGKYLGGFIGGQVICKDAPSDIMRLSVVQNVKEEDLTKKENLSDLSGSREYSYKEVVAISRLVELVINQLTKKEIISEHNKLKNVNKIKKLEEKIKILEYEKNKYKNDYLELKINNNIFVKRNILNTIFNLSILEDAKLTNDAILKYSEYINNDLDDSYNIIRKELQKIEKLIDITKIRYKDKITYSVSFDEKVLGQKMPFSFILPFVYASLYFFLTLKEDDYKLSIDIQIEDCDIVCKIVDNGLGLSLSELESKYKIYGKNHEGIAMIESIYSIKKSFKDMFGKQYAILVESKKGIGSTITIKYPMNYEEVI